MLKLGVAMRKAGVLRCKAISVVRKECQRSANERKTFSIGFVGGRAKVAAEWRGEWFPDVQFCKGELYHPPR